ncbi:CUB and sushi domain-containing protein 3-like [Corticium candelabrum]|uniref:CUB and sushi domain-containing protein 3-like n=1 Tax=Corticium candelabrum TaxID=121492 RepID=UPI002E26FC7A|nr:CUB and sushi domain-containing protein 3-like [Corticium candelabrum]
MPDYFPTTPQTIKCLIHGNWSLPLPSCASVFQCSPMPQLENGIVAGNRYDAIFSCFYGYRLLNSGSAYCGKNSTWRYPNQRPRCQVMRCKKLTSLLHGNVQTLDLTVNSTIDYACREGYIREGIKSRTCRANKITAYWDPPEQTSTVSCKAKNCGRPEERLHCIRMGNYFQYPGVVKYDRAYGHCIVGPKQIQCNSSGQWSNETPSCKKIQCPPLSDPQNGTVLLSSEQRFVDDTATYSCHSGYELNMDKTLTIFTRTCLQPEDFRQCTGIWSDKPPCCIPRSCPDPNTSNFRNGGIQGNAYFYPETISLNCTVGHELVGGGSYFQCNESGQWYEISKPSDDASNQARKRINSELEKVKNCISKTIKTKHFSHKVRQFPSCQPVSCGRPPPLLNGRYEGHVFSYGAMVRYHCNVGYCLVGTNTSICLKEGYWSSNTHRKCQALKCPNLQSISNGSVSVPSNYLGETATYQCKTGFDLIGSRKRSCQKRSSVNCSLTWTEHPPTCRAKDCGDPGVISRGRIAVIQGDGRRYPSYIQFICNLGYQIVEGTEFMTCSNSQVWKGKRPKCQPVYCGALEQPKNGEIVGNNFYFGESVTFSCNRGYMIIGKETSMCAASGTWTNTPPRCIETRCFPIQRQKHGRVVATGNKIGSVLVFQCTLGYVLKGSSTLHCVQIKNFPAKWNMPIPKCQGKY